MSTNPDPDKSNGELLVSAKLQENQQKKIERRNKKNQHVISGVFMSKMFSGSVESTIYQSSSSSPHQHFLWLVFLEELLEVIWSGNILSAKDIIPLHTIVTDLFGITFMIHLYKFGMDDSVGFFLR